MSGPLRDQDGKLSTEALILRIAGVGLLAVVVVGVVLLESFGRETDRILTWVGSVLIPAALVMLSIDRQRVIRQDVAEVKTQTEEVAQTTTTVKHQTNGRLSSIEERLAALDGRPNNDPHGTAAQSWTPPS